MSQGEDRTQRALTATRILLATVNATPGRPSALAFPSSSPSSMLRVRACMASAVFKVFLRPRVHSESRREIPTGQCAISALETRARVFISERSTMGKNQKREAKNTTDTLGMSSTVRAPPCVSIHRRRRTRLFPFPVPRPDRRPRSGVNPFRLLTPRHPP